MRISLPPELKRIVDQQLASGMYHSPSEVVSEALRQMNFQHLSREQRLRILKREVKRGADQIRRGQYKEYTSGTLRQLKDDVRKLAAERFRRKAG
jgi:antitoxin ParD1/3/4